MKTYPIPAACKMVVLACLAGLASESRAEDVAKESRQKIIAALKMAREEFLNGAFLQEEKLVLTDVFLAEQSQKTAGEALKTARSLAEKRVMTPLQVEAAASVAQNADKRLEVAQQKLKSLRESKSQVLEQFNRLESIFREVSWK